MPLELEIQIGVREATGTPVLLSDDFARHRRKFIAESAAPGSRCKEMAFVTPRLNRSDVLPGVAFILGTAIPVMRCEKYRYACGASGLKRGEHIWHTIDRFCYLLDHGPKDAPL